ncbi:IcmT/TraK family protein [Dyella ginsengisoli]|jgi:intracellular multiplication protein IcmT|uniref:IcmT/TraK family protein n=1 Tax=Dyella ginsengisoli TaxID=363848 RepID=UPI00034AB031|nr:IcmT/TraK family protein [Dyella ginsengisoli]
MKRSTWRHCSNPPTIPLLPGLGVSPFAFLPLLLWLFHWSWTMFYIALGSVALFVVLAKVGYTRQTATGLIRHRLRGSRIHARPWWYRKRFAPVGNRVGSLRSDVTYDEEGDVE